MSELPAMLGGALGGVVAYLWAESAFSARPHPLHWLVALAGAVIGAAAGFGIAWATSRRG